MKKRHGADDRPRLSSVILNDTNSVWVDDGKKSVAYFCKKAPVKVDNVLIATLKNTFTKIGNRNLRLCLHPAPDAPLHEMIILERKGKYYRPHKHLTKGETFHIIEGTLGVFSFDDRGNIIDSCILEPNSQIIYKIATNMYHAVMPLSDLVIYQETKLGPFTGETDSIYPPWAPDGQGADAIEAYNIRMSKALEG